MASSTVNCIYQDCRGYLWFGTDNGLSRFDGMDFQNYKKTDGLPGNGIVAIHESNDGLLWIGTDDNGAARFDGKQFTSFSTRDGLAGNRVFSIKKDKKGALWFATSGGLSCFDGKRFKSFTTKSGLPSNFVISLALDDQDTLWVGTESGPAYLNSNRLPNTQVSNLRFTCPLQDNPLQNTGIMEMAPAGNGGMWLGTTQGLFLLEKGNPVRVSAVKDLSNGKVNTVLEANDGSTWVGMEKGIAFVSGSKPEFITTENGLPNNLIRAILRDREGNLWFGTQNGAARLSQLKASLYTGQDGLSDNMIVTLLQDRGNRIWIGTARGLSCYTGNGSASGFKKYSTKNGLIGNHVQHLQEDGNGNIWIATSSGISVLDPITDKFTNYTTQNPLPARNIFHICRGRDGTLWIGGSGGLRCFRDGAFSPHPFPVPRLNYVLAILEDHSGNLWFSSQETLYRANGNIVKSYTSTNRLPVGLIRNLFADSRGRVWVAGHEGLACIDGNTVTGYTTHDGLPDNLCYYVMEDDTSVLWIGTANGIARFDGKHFESFTVPALGLTGGSSNAGIIDREGQLWLGGDEGLVRIAAPFTGTNTVPPPIHITGVKVLEKELPLSNFVQPPRFSHEENYIRFTFTGICLTAPENVTYHYRLAHLDSKWHDTRSRSVFYPYLPPGDYRFQVKAVNNHGIESNQPAELYFSIAPPFQQTIWFRLLLGLVLVSLILLFINRRIKRAGEKAELKARTAELKAHKAELESKKQQLVMSQRMELMGTLATGTVHDLKNLLAVILGYSKLVKSKVKANDRDDQSLQHADMIKNTAETAMQMTRQILSFSRYDNSPPRNVDLGIAMGEILKTLEISIPNNIHPSWTPPGEPVLFPIHPARFQQVVMNLCLNAIQAMPRGGNLTLSLNKRHDGTDNRNILLEVGDTGTGMDAETIARIFDPLFTTKKEGKGTGLGLYVVKQIVEDHNGRIEVASQPGEGTTFTVIF